MRPTRLAARSTRRRVPPDSSPTRRAAMSCSSNRSTRSPARPRAAPRRPARRPTSSRFSNVVRKSSSPAYWPVTPMRRRTSAGCATASTPSMTTRPRSGRIDVVMTRMSVVLPAPLWPSTARVRPGATLQVDPVEGRGGAVGDLDLLDDNGVGDGGDCHVTSPGTPAQHGPVSVDVVVQHATGRARIALVGVVGQDGVELPGAQRHVGGVDPHLVLHGVAAAVGFGHRVSEGRRR